MLKIVEEEGLDRVVSWYPHGRSFMIHRPKEFVETLLPRFFKQSKLTSFHRQLNLYGFLRITSDHDRGCHYHPLFLRGRPEIAKIIFRTRVKGGADAIIPSDYSVQGSEHTSFDALPPCPSASTAGWAKDLLLVGSESVDECVLNEDEEKGTTKEEQLTRVTKQQQQLPSKSATQRYTVLFEGRESLPDELPAIPIMEGEEPAQDEDLEQALEMLLHVDHGDPVQQHQQNHPISQNMLERSNGTTLFPDNRSLSSSIEQPSGTPLYQPVLFNPYCNPSKFNNFPIQSESQPVTNILNLLPFRASNSLEGDYLMRGDDESNSNVVIDHDMGLLTSRSFNRMDGDQRDTYESGLIEAQSRAFTF